MREIETQAVGRDQRPFLRHVIAEDLPQRFVQQMRGRMILPDGASPCMIDIQVERSPGLEAALPDRAEMHEEVAGAFLRVGDGKTHAVRGHHADVADLPAGLGIERRLIENDGAALAFLQGTHFLAVAKQCDDDACGGLRLIAEEIGGAELSRSANQTASSADLPEPAHEARAFSRWRSMASVNDAIDVDLARLERSWVRSSGKP